MSDSPEYNIDEIVYLKESAALGFLEAMRISSVIRSSTASDWLYTLSVGQLPPIGVSHYGDRISGRGHTSSGQLVYFTGDEFVTLCEALHLIRDFLQSKLSSIEAQIADLCADST